MTRQEFINGCKDYGIAHYNRLVRQWEQGKQEILYVASTPYGHNYGGYQKNTTRCYIWTESEGWHTWFSNLSNHRAGIVLKARVAGRLNEVAPVVLNNYITNGYSTRRGLFANYSVKAMERMGKIAQSHADYFGHEVDSTTDHANRVAMRSR